MHHSSREQTTSTYTTHTMWSRRGLTAVLRGSRPLRSGGRTPNPLNAWGSVASRSVTSAQSQALEENRRARIELAASYRILERLGFHEGICNHLSMMTKSRDGSGSDVMLLVPYGLHWREVTASSLVGISSSGEVVEGEGAPETTAFHIHAGVRHLHNQKCVFHTHPPYTTALACLKDPTLLPCHQTAIRFYKRIAYDTEFDGYGDNKAEGQRLGSKLGMDKDAMVMGNHGLLTVGDSAAFAFDCTYYIERLAMTQVLAMSTGKEISLVPEDIIVKSQEYAGDIPKMSKLHFNAHLRLLYKDCPEFAA